MASITLKGLPSKLHRALKKQAARHNRSLNREVLEILESSLQSAQKIDVKAMLERAEKFRASLNFVTTAEEIDALKKEGRR